MTEGENLDAAPQEQEIINPQPEETQQDQPQNNTQYTQFRESRNDRNWRELRKQKEEWEREARIQREINQRLLAQTAQQPQSDPETDILEEIANEEFVAGEKVARGLKKINQKFEKKLEEIESRYNQKHQSSLLNDLKREFPDFDDVVNPENLEILEETNPRLAAAIARSNDPYLIAIQSYEYLKAKGLSKSSNGKVTEAEKRIEQNKKTVPSPHVFEKRPMAQAFQLTDEMKKELQREMYQYAGQVGMGY
jgi:hypothetical protein